MSTTSFVEPDMFGDVNLASSKPSSRATSRVGLNDILQIVSDIKNDIQLLKTDSQAEDFGKAVADVKAELLLVKKANEVTTKLLVAIAEAVNVQNIEEFISVPETPDSNIIDKLSDGLYKTLSFLSMSHFDDNHSDLHIPQASTRDITQAMAQWASFCSDELSGRRIEDEWAILTTRQRLCVFLEMRNWVLNNSNIPSVPIEQDTGHSGAQMARQGNDPSPSWRPRQNTLRPVSRVPGPSHSRTKSTPAAVQSPSETADRTLSPFDINSPNFYGRAQDNSRQRTTSAATMKSVLQKHTQSPIETGKALDVQHSATLQVQPTTHTLRHKPSHMSLMRSSTSGDEQ